MRQERSRICSMIAALGLLAAAPATASTMAADLPRTAHDVTIDGDLSDAAWRDATQVRIEYETNPGENVPARVETLAYLVENGESLFIAFDASDPDPDQIRAYLRDRDSAYNDDFVGIVIDTYGDERRAFEFFANPLGVQMDLTNDDVNRIEDDSWDAIWDAAGRIHDGGFVVEMEIPLSQLRFPRREGKQRWGFDLLRFYPRDKRYRLSNNPLDRNRNCYLCQFSKLEGLADATPGRDLEIVPTLTASRSESSDDPGVVPLDGADTRTEAGLSVRWGITPDLTANLAINPDFSQVEADVAQLDVNNQFALFFPEKRPFFLEGADYFNTPIDAVFTRTVAAPDLGAKLTGKRGDHTFGVFAAEDSVTNLLFPGPQGSDATSLEQSNTAFVGRYSRGFGDASSVGALLTSRSGDDYHNHVGGLDMRWKISDQHSIRAQVLRSDTRYPDATATEFEQPLGSFSGLATGAEYEFDTREWFAYLRHEQYDRDFRADSGFVPQVDASQQVVGLGRIWRPDDDTWWTQVRVNGDWDITHDDDGNVLEREVEAYVGLGGPMQSWIQVGGLSRDVFFDGQMFRENKLSFYVEGQPRGGLLLGLWMRDGDQVDFANTRLGDQLRVEPFVRWNATRNLALRIDGASVRLDSKQGANIFDARLADVRATWQFSVRSFLRFTAQFQDVERNQAEYIDEVDARSRGVGRQLLYSYKINPQTVFFLGYSDNHVDDDELAGLEPTDRTWFLKIGYAWTP